VWSGAPPIFQSARRSIRVRKSSSKPSTAITFNTQHTSYLQASSFDCVVYRRSKGSKGMSAMNRSAHAAPLQRRALHMLLMALICISHSAVAWSPSIVTRKMLNNPGNPRINSKQDSRSQLSISVLASCDTLPSFPTAHGLLSPETVMRLEDSTSGESRSQALQDFLMTYRSQGPLSCLPMLSDPNVLPHLVTSMRLVVA
jgi:hypothetical protein